MNRLCVFSGALLLGVIAVFFGGCQKRPMFEYSDEPYIYRYQNLNDSGLKKLLLSNYADDRMIALRVAARRARKAGEAGNSEAVSTYRNMILNHFDRERNSGVRSFLVGVAIPDAGQGGEAVYNFLLRCLETGESAPEACKTLAGMYPDRSLEILKPMLRHPRAETRYAAMLAMTTLPDPAAIDLLEKEVAKMQKPAWPEMVGEVPLAACRDSIVSRLESLKKHLGIAAK